MSRTIEKDCHFIRIIFFPDQEQGKLTNGTVISCWSEGEVQTKVELARYIVDQRPVKPP
jgi:hypothetical protein